MKTKQAILSIAILLTGISFNVFKCKAQGGIWTWMKGDSTGTSWGNYGTIGQPNINNTPPNKYQGAYCVDKNNIAWIFGGNGGSGTSDLWKYDHATNMWTWMKGPQNQGQPPVYGTKGVADPFNNPHSTFVSGMMVCDSNNNLWHMGNFMNTLWKFDITTNNWTWMHGDTIYNLPANYGIKGIPSPTVVPSRVIESKSLWYCASDHNIYLYDNKQCMWRYNITTNQWVWLKGDSTGATYNYGTKGIEDSLNQPPPTLPNNRSETHVIWQDKNDMLYILDQQRTVIWRYNPQTNNWMWLHGDTLSSPLPILGSPCTRGLGLKPCGGNVEARGASAQFNGRDVLYLYSGMCWDNILWRFDLDSLEWIRVSGGGIPANFGIQTLPNPSNHPPAADGHCLWADHNNSIWLFSTYPFGPNYLWRFDPDPCCGQQPDTSGINLPIPQNVSICSGDTVQYAMDTTLNILINSSTGNGYTMVNQSLLLHPTQTTTFTLYLSNLNKCLKDTLSIVVNVLQQDTLHHYDLDSIICKNESTSLQIVKGYKMHLEPNNQFSINSDSTLITFSPQTTTTYTLITKTSGLCPIEDTISFTIQVNPTPVANFIVDPNSTSMLSPEFKYTNTSFNATKFRWIHDGTVFSNDIHAQKTFLDTGLKCVTLIAENLECMDSITHCNRIVDEKFYIPNAFSPNGDDLNDSFKPVFLSNFNPRNYTFRIYNRYGEKVFQSYEAQKGWNGRYKNEPSDSGVYYYFITFKKGEKEVMYKGDVTLIR